MFIDLKSQGRFIVRWFQKTDILKVTRIFHKFHKENFNLPSLRNSLPVVALHDNEIVAFGSLKLLAEAILVLDLDKPLRQKVETVKLLLQHAIEAAKERELEELHFFVKDPNFAKVLQKHFDFKEYSGKTLVLRL